MIRLRGVYKGLEARTMKTVRYEQQLYDSDRLISPHLFGLR